MLKEKLLQRLPPNVHDNLDALGEFVGVVREMRDPKVLASLGPSAVKGLVLHRGKQGTPTQCQATYKAHFDWTYPADQPAMRELFQRAKRGQWDSDRDLPWGTDVDIQNPATRLLPEKFVNHARLREHGVRLDVRERMRLDTDVGTWMLSQFLHGEQGALFAAAQVTEAVPFFDGKLYGSTQVMDEGRHVEVFHRYLSEKLGKLYQVNDNLFVIIDALMADSRWDMKFLGMQIMVEGLALGAFGTLYRMTSEPLLKELLRRVILDEARHVHYGVLALKKHFAEDLSERERNEREDWAFEVALLMRNRFMGYEVYDEWFSGGASLTRAAWREVVSNSYGMNQFRHVMFSRLMPNLREIGLLTPRILPAYERAGLLTFMSGKAAPELSGEELMDDLEKDQPYDEVIPPPT